MSATYRLHPGYHLDRLRGLLVNDFALLRLSATVDFSSYPHISPICLPSPGFEDYDNLWGTVTGWGYKKVEFLRNGLYVRGYGSVTSDTLQKLDMRFGTT